MRIQRKCTKKYVKEATKQTMKLNRLYGLQDHRKPLNLIKKILVIPFETIITKQLLTQPKLLPFFNLLKYPKDVHQLSGKAVLIFECLDEFLDCTGNGCTEGRTGLKCRFIILLEVVQSRTNGFRGLECLILLVEMSMSYFFENCGLVVKERV